MRMRKGLALPLAAALIGLSLTGCPSGPVPGDLPRLSDSWPAYSYGPESNRNEKLQVRSVCGLSDGGAALAGLGGGFSDQPFVARFEGDGDLAWRRTGRDYRNLRDVHEAPGGALKGIAYGYPTPDDPLHARVTTVDSDGTLLGSTLFRMGRAATFYRAAPMDDGGLLYGGTGRLSRLPFAAKLKANGSEAWARTFSGDPWLWIEFQAFAEHDGDAVLAAHGYVALDEESAGKEDGDENGDENDDEDEASVDLAAHAVLVARMDGGSGALIWETTLSFDEELTHIGDVRGTPDGGAVGAAYGSAANETYLIKFDAAGDLEWIGEYDFEHLQRPRVRALPQGGYLLWAEDEVSEEVSTYILLWGIGADGTPLWEYVFPEYLVVTALDMAPDGGAVAAGHYFDAARPWAPRPMFVLRLGLDGEVPD